MIAAPDLLGRIGNQLSLQLTRSDLGWRRAWPYTRHHARCRHGYREAIASDPADPVSRAATDFARHGSCALWTPGQAALAEAVTGRVRADEATRGDAAWDGNAAWTGDLYRALPEIEPLLLGPLGRLLVASYCCHFKVWSAALYRTERGSVPRGSQLWHIDDGPGTCINVIVYLHDIADGEGEVECLGWDASLSVLRQERVDLAHLRGAPRAVLFAAKGAYYEEQIRRRHAGSVFRYPGAAGQAVLFGYNTLHRSGYARSGAARYALVFHCYPSSGALPVARYRQAGIPIRGPSDFFPQDPAFDE